jgi:hypothetical protein
LRARLHSEAPQCGLDPPDPDLDALRLYVADRLADLYSRDYHVYMRRWRTLAPGDEPGPRLGFREWWGLVQELEERNLALHDYLLTTIALPEIALDPLADAVAEAEERAFRELHPQLVQHYPGQYVAVAGGRVVDLDADQATLYRRVRLAYPAQFVLIAQVQPAPEEVFVFRSPRIIREQTNDPLQQ